MAVGLSILTSLEGGNITSKVPVKRKCRNFDALKKNVKINKTDVLLGSYMLLQSLYVVSEWKLALSDSLAFELTVQPARLHQMPWQNRQAFSEKGSLSQYVALIDHKAAGRRCIVVCDGYASSSKNHEDKKITKHGVVELQVIIASERKCPMSKDMFVGNEKKRKPSLPIFASWFLRTLRRLFQMMAATLWLPTRPLTSVQHLLWNSWLWCSGSLESPWCQVSWGYILHNIKGKLLHQRYLC